jgi:TPR repeat protein
MTLRSVLGTPPPLQTGLDTSEDSSEKTDSTTRSHNSPTFMNHQQADMTILDHYLLKPRRAMNKRRMSTTSLRTNHFQQSDLETATAMISMAAEPHFDYPLAQYCYAMCLLQGIGCTADIEKGEMILERAATRNEPMAMFELAAQLERQNDDDDDDGGWLKWMQRAADHPTMPHREACYRLGLFLYQGHCKTPFAHLDGSIQRKGEKHRAAHYFRRAAALGIVLPSMYARWAWKRKYDNKQ